MNTKVLLTVLTAIGLSSCSVLANPSPQPLPTVVLGGKNATAQADIAPPASGGVSASGYVVPAQEIHLAFAVQARVKNVNVAVGDQVKAGQVLVQLDDAVLQAQMHQAQAAVTVAQANYDLLAAKPADEQLRQAEGALLQATANYSRTIAASRPGDVAAAQAALTAAVDAYDKVKAGPQQEDFAAAEANYRNAEATLKQAQYAYDNAYSQNPAAIGASPAALGLEQATNNYAAAKAEYDKQAKAPDNAQISAAYQVVVSARATLDRALNPARDFDVAQAQGQVDVAQAQLDALKAGPRAQQLDAARAQVAAAQSALAVLNAQAPDFQLLAPVDSVVFSRAVQPGETVLPGAQALTLADLNQLRIETKDLSERDVPAVAVGQAVSVLVKALNKSVPGHVSAIAPMADTLGGDVVYKTTIELDTRPPGLRAGMSVDVQFGQ